MTTLIDARLLGILANATNRDHAGRHFTERDTDDSLDTLEAAGLIEIRRPVHDATGLPYSCEYWHLEVTEAGRQYVEDHYDPRDYEPDGVTPLE